MTKRILPILFLSIFFLRAETNSPPLLRAHAHNDYEHKRPLFEALEHRFCSIEADIHLTNGQLLVAHDLKNVRPELTLEKLYLQPLRAQILKNGARVYRDGPSVILLIDVKSEPQSTYPVLRKLLESYSALLTKFDSDKTETNALTVIITGNRPVEMMTREKNRLASCDGRLDKLSSEIKPDLFPLVSEDWRSYFLWQGDGEIPYDEKELLREFSHQAHRYGRRLRFWGTPDKPKVWRELIAANVDLIGADNLDALEKFLRSIH